MENTVSIIPIGGVGDVTKNMYLYEYKDEILIVDCGIGFADETMVGVDLLLPDISYLLQTKKKIVGMVFTHGHEDHIGAIPFILPQLPEIPLYATPLTAALANEKLKEFNIKNRVKTVTFEDCKRTIGSFTTTFIRITHSVPDSSHIFIETPAGNFYHGADFKFDLTPYDEQHAEFGKITEAAKKGITCLMSDCLGAEKKGSTPSEQVIGHNFRRVMQDTKGKFILTTYSSNISRLNQAIEVAHEFDRKVCFVGRSLVKAKEVAQSLGYIKGLKGIEVPIEGLRKIPDNKLLLFVAGSQGQENSAMSRIANDEHREIRLTKEDVIVFSSDAIPGNEVAVNSLIDTLSKKNVRVVSSNFTDEYHVSGHGFSYDLKLLISLTKPKHLLPIGGTFRLMTSYRALAESLGHKPETVHLLDDGQEIIFEGDKARLGRKIASRNVYVDQMSGEEVEHYVLRDRQQVAEEGVVVALVQVDTETGQVIDKPDIIARGVVFSPEELNKISIKLRQRLEETLGTRKGKVRNWVHVRKQITEQAQNLIFRQTKRNPLVLPVVIEV